MFLLRYCSWLVLAIAAKNLALASALPSYMPIDSVKKNATVEVLLPFIDVPPDSVAYYMELLRRLGNRESVDDMTITTTSQPKPENNPIAEKTASVVQSTPPSAPLYAMNVDFLATEKSAYQRLLDEIDIRRATFAMLYSQTNNNTTKRQVLEEAAKYWTEIIAQSFMAQLDGKTLTTPNKARNVDSATPNKAFIVSILHDIGFAADFSNFQIATPRSIAKSLATNNALKYCKNLDELDGYLAKKGRGLYILAYDKYVAFIWNDGMETLLLLSDPLNDNKITQEPLQKASAFKSYIPYFNVGSLSDNTNLIAKWLTESKIELQK